MKKSNALLMPLLIFGMMTITACNSNSYYDLWDSNKTYFTVTWKNYDGTILKIEKLTEQSTPYYSSWSLSRKSDNPQYGYVFNKWEPDISPVIADVVYTAQYNRVVKYTNAHFDLNGGTSTSPITDKTAKNLSSSLFNYDITKPNYQFRGWAYNGMLMFNEYGACV